MKIFILLLMSTNKLHLGMTKKEVKEILGEPSEIVYKYGSIELVFGPNEDSGLITIIDNDFDEILSEKVKTLEVVNENSSA